LEKKFKECEKGEDITPFDGMGFCDFSRKLGIKL
jgi:hypothetical protein